MENYFRFYQHTILMGCWDTQRSYPNSMLGRNEPHEFHAKIFSNPFHIALFVMSFAAQYVQREKMLHSNVHENERCFNSSWIFYFLSTRARLAIINMFETFNEMQASHCANLKDVSLSCVSIKCFVVAVVNMQMWPPRNIYIKREYPYDRKSKTEFETRDYCCWVSLN